MMHISNKGYALLIVLLTILLVSLCAIHSTHLYFFSERASNTLRRAHTLFWTTEHARLRARQIIQNQQTSQCYTDNAHTQWNYVAQQMQHGEIAYACTFLDPLTHTQAYFWIETLQTIPCIYPITTHRSAIIYRITSASMESDHPAVVTQSILSLAYPSQKNCTTPIWLPIGWLSFSQA